MMRYKCVVSYVGRNYSGWQSQRMGDSIQEILEAVIERMKNAILKGGQA